MANITRYTPYEDLFNELTRGFFVRPLGTAPGSELQIKLDVKEDDKSYKVRAEIPGVKKEDIHVDVEASHVSVRGGSTAEREASQADWEITGERRCCT